MTSSGRVRPRIALLTNTIAYGYQNELLTGAHREAERLGLDLFCFSGGDVTGRDAGARRRSNVFRLIGSTNVDGVIVSTSTIANFGRDAALRFIEGFRPLPVVSIGVELPGVPSIVVDNQVGVFELTSHLVGAHGRRRVAFVSGPRENVESNARLAGYRSALEVRGLEANPELVVVGNFRRISGYESARELLVVRGLRPDAIVCANDWMACGVLDYLAEQRLDVPGEIAVVGFDDVDGARFTAPPLSTVRQPIAELAVHAVRTLASALGVATETHELRLPTQVRLRQSCGCPPAYLEWGSPEALKRPSVRATSGASALSAGIEPTPIERVLARHSDRLAAAIEHDLAAGDETGFVSAVAEIAGSLGDMGELRHWHLAVERAAAPSFEGDLSEPARERLERIVARAHICVGATGEQLQATRWARVKETLRNLHFASAWHRVAFDEPAILEAFERSLPGLRIAGSFIALLTEGELGPEAAVRLSFATHGPGDRRWPPAEGATERVVTFRAGELIPLEFALERRHTAIVEPLLMGSEPLGFAVLEFGGEEGQEGVIYEELGEQLSGAFTASKLLRDVVAEVTRREHAERARLEDEFRIARKIQEDLAPTVRHVEGLEIATVVVPVTEVGGDYHDVLPFEGGSWIAIGDVAGHGLPAGLVMTMLQSIVAATTFARPTASALEVWSAVNSLLYVNVRERLRTDEHVTLTLLRYERDGRLAFAGAHEDLVIYRKRTGKCEIVPTVGVWAAIRKDHDSGVAIESYARLEPGDVLLLYSDGVTEAVDAGGRLYGIERLASELAAAAPLPVDAIRDRLRAAIETWQIAQRDDMTLLVARYTPPAT